MPPLHMNERDFDRLTRNAAAAQDAPAPRRVKAKRDYRADLMAALADAIQKGQYRRMEVLRQAVERLDAESDALDVGRRP
jgi:hypothetical protein